MEMTGELSYFQKRMLEASPGRGRNVSRGEQQGKEHAGLGMGRSGQATSWTVMLSLSLFPTLYYHLSRCFPICSTRGWDLCCGSPDLASLMMNRQLSLLGWEAFCWTHNWVLFRLICWSRALSQFLIHAYSRGEAGMGLGGNGLASYTQKPCSLRPAFPPPLSPSFLITALRQHCTLLLPGHRVSSPALSSSWRSTV